MKKCIISIIAVLLCVMSMFASLTALADEVTLSMVENIIAGNQDKLVFATIVSISNDVCLVEIMEEIGTDKTVVKNELNEDDESNKASSLIGTKIDVEGLSSYMYYGEFEHRPKKGDNVLLSLTFKGNVYRIKNGAFVVNAASHDTFNFIVPESIDGTQSAMELTALYKFVGSNGRNADYRISDNAVYTHDIASGEEIKIQEQAGITFINEKGETTKEAEGNNFRQSAYQTDTSRSWAYAVVIIVVGWIAGLFIMKLIIKLEKKAESK